LALSHRERAAGGRVRDLQDLTIPHPSLRDALSRWERADSSNFKIPLLLVSRGGCALKKSSEAASARADDTFVKVSDYFGTTE